MFFNNRKVTSLQVYSEKQQVVLTTNEVAPGVVAAVVAGTNRVLYSGLLGRGKSL